MYIKPYQCYLFKYMRLMLNRFEKKVNLRKFDKFVTEVQVNAHELQDRKRVVDEV